MSGRPLTVLSMRRTHPFAVTRSVLLRGFLCSTLLVGFGFVGSIRPLAAQESSNFTTPSRNIDCLIFQLDGLASASCVVKSDSWRKLPKKPADCDLDWSPTEVGISEETERGKRKVSVYAGVCRGDIGPLCPPDSCRVLGYGKSITIASFTCTSRTTGMTCLDRKSSKKRGFTVNRSGYQLYR